MPRKAAAAAVHGGPLGRATPRLPPPHQSRAGARLSANHKARTHLPITPKLVYEVPSTRPIHCAGGKNRQVSIYRRSFRRARFAKRAPGISPAKTSSPGATEGRCSQRGSPFFFLPGDNCTRIATVSTSNPSHEITWLGRHRLRGFVWNRTPIRDTRSEKLCPVAIVARSCVRSPDPSSGLSSTTKPAALRGCRNCHRTRGASLTRLSFHPWHGPNPKGIKQARSKLPRCRKRPRKRGHQQVEKTVLWSRDGHVRTGTEPEGGTPHRPTAHGPPSGSTARHSGRPTGWTNHGPSALFPVCR